MSRLRWEANLKILFDNLRDYADNNGIPVAGTLSGIAERLSSSLYLAHSTSDARFSNICDLGFIASAASMAVAGGRSLPANCVEVAMGTADSVFLYVAPFRYPNTGCGLLFAQSLETYNSDDGTASPFDSGGLHTVFKRQDVLESPKDFLQRHEIPIPEHRSYLGLSLDVLFGAPSDYLDGFDPARVGPIGLEGGDCRRWTHEVRIPNKVFLRSSHLQAVFVPRPRVAADAAIEDFLQWCVMESVDRIVFDTPRGDDFEALQRESLSYIRQKLY